MLTEKELELIDPTKHLVASLFRLGRRDVLNFILNGSLTGELHMELEATVYFLGFMSVTGATTALGISAYELAAGRVEHKVPGFINNTLCPLGGRLGELFNFHSFAGIEARILANRKAGDLAWSNGKRDKGSRYHQDARDLQARLDGTKSKVSPVDLERLHKFFHLGVDHSSTLRLSPLPGLAK